MGENSNINSSKIPILSPAPLRRSGSLRLRTCPPIQEHNTTQKLNRHHSLQSLNKVASVCPERDDDLDSVQSFSSSASVCSTLSQCEHSTFARNGTTYSGRCNRYVVHCSHNTSDNDDYLTPTQRTNRTIRKLKSLLRDAQVQLTEKDKEIARLTKEVVELRLLKADSGTEPNDQDQSTKVESQSLDTVAEERPSGNHAMSSPLAHPRYCPTPPLTQSLSDSGHFEDLNSSKENSHSSQSHLNHLKAVELLQRQHEDEIRELKEKHFDKVESLLQRITDVNDRYYALRPLYEECKENVNKLEQLNEELKNSYCKDHHAKIVDLEKANNDLIKENHAIVSDLTLLRTSSSSLELIKNNNDKLKKENEELIFRNKKLEEENKRVREDVCKSCTNKTIQTEIILTEQGSNNVKVAKYFADKSVETEIFNCSNERNSVIVDGSEHCNNLREENSKLSLQIEAYREKLKMLEEQQSNEKNLYVQLYNKGFEAATLENSKEMNGAEKPEKETALIPELLQKLEIKQEELDNIKSMYRRLLEQKKGQPKHDPEMTLQFLKSAIYYFLTDRENAPGHLTAIESILGFSDNEKSNIDRAYFWR